MDDPLLNNLADLAAELREFNGESRRQAVRGGTNRPYYREGPARELALIIDQLADTHATQLIACPADLLFSTHRNKISQAKSYLLDHLDPAGKYAELFSHINMVHKERIKLTYIKFSSPPLTSKSAPDWTSELIKWIDSNPGMHDKFERTGLALNDEQVNTLTEFTSKLDPDKYLSAVSAGQIIVVRMDN